MRPVPTFREVIDVMHFTDLHGDQDYDVDGDINCGRDVCCHK